tara:strand:+ start:208 stop:594 length:387 start_codon:yes stop_codon:yes gene_type:complete
VDEVTGWIAILLPAIIVFVVFFFAYKMHKNKNEALIEVAKSLQDPNDIRDLIDAMHEKKKPIDYRRTGVITLFAGIGLFLFGIYFIGDILKGVGLLLAAIGIGQLIAGYLYPNEGVEITQAVERFEEK